MYTFGREGTVPASAASSKRSSRKKELINSKVEKISKKLEQDRQRDERAARRALRAKKREAQMKVDEATKRQIEKAEQEIDEMAAKLKRELSMKHMEREIVLAEARAKAWDEVSSSKSSTSSSTTRSSAVIRNQSFIGGSDVHKYASMKLTKEQRVDLNTTKHYLSYLAELNQGPRDWRFQDANFHAPYIVGPRQDFSVPLEPRFTYNRERPTASDFPFPRPEIQSFDGDPLHYQAFVSSFRTHILSKVESDHARLTYLLQFCHPDVRSMIDHYVGTTFGFNKAWEKLYYLYGRPLVVANRCEEKLLQCPKIKRNDGESLRKLANIMEKACVQLDGIESFTSLNSLSTLQRIVEKFPEKIQDKWIEWSFDLTQETKREVTFRDMVLFVRREAELINSVFGKSRWSAVRTETAVWEAKKYKSVTSSTVVSKHVPESIPYKKTCKLCKGIHLLPECQEFKKMRHYKRLEFAKKESLCFKCLCSGHVAGDCKSSEECSVEGCINPKHHTLLHKNIPQTVATAITQTNIENSLLLRRQNSLQCLPILPVKVRDGLLSFTTCALLDSGSQQTFCTNDLAKRLGVQGEMRSLQTKTMSQKNEIEAFRGKVISFFVDGLDGEMEIRLDRVLTVDRLPVDAQAMPQKEDFKQWDHLQDVHFPIVVNKKVELLIGIDNKQAFTPLDCRTGPENAPEALMTPLGWVLYGPLLRDITEPLDLSCVSGGA